MQLLTRGYCQRKGTKNIKLSTIPLYITVNYLLKILSSVIRKYEQERGQYNRAYG